MPVLKALKAFPYGVSPNRVRLRAGDLFNCDDKHVPILVRSHLAILPEVVIAQPVLAYQTRHMEAEMPKRRGRPPGSKNKPKDMQAME